MENLGLTKEAWKALGFQGFATGTFIASLVAKHLTPEYSDIINGASIALIALSEYVYYVELKSSKPQKADSQELKELEEKKTWNKNLEYKQITYSIKSQ